MFLTLNGKERRLCDSMTPIERIKAIVAGECVDRMPVYMFADPIISTILGKTRAECESSARGLADIQIKGYREFGYDSVGLSLGYSVPIALGGEWKQLSNSSIELISNPVQDINNLSILDLDAVNLNNDKIAAKALEAAKYIREEIGKEVECSISMRAPMSVAAGLVKLEQFLISLVKNPEKANEVLEFALEAQMKIASVFIEEGFEISISDPVASGSLISPKLYRKYAKPYEQKMAKSLEELSGKLVNFHICGDTNKILEDIAECGFGSYSMDNMVDIKTAKDLIGSKISLSGNVDPVHILRFGNPKMIREEVRKCFRLAWDSPKGFSICTGCEMCYETPMENVKAYIDEAKLCAAEQAQALKCKKEIYVWDKEVV